MDVTSVATVVALFVVNCGGFVNDGAGTFTQVSANLDGCVCPGDQLTYECSSFGGVATVWHGSAFSNCSGQDNNEIILRHSRFNVLGTTSSATAALDCNGQSLVARSIGVINDTFTSQLTVNATIDTSNKTIQCDREDANGTKILVGTMSIQFTVLIRDVSRSLHISNLHLDHVVRNQLLFKWSSVTVGLPCFISYLTLYDIQSDGCGHCEISATESSATCYLRPEERRKAFSIAMSCNFTIKNVQVCGDNVSVNESIIIMLYVPDPPMFVVSSQHHFETGSASILVTFNESQYAFNLSIGIDGSPLFYTITYSDSISGLICSNSTINASSCVMGICNHVYEISSSNNCCPKTGINVTILPINRLGDGPISNPVAIALSTPEVIMGGCNANGNVTAISITVVLVVVLLIILLVVVTLTVILFLRRKFTSKPKINRESLNRSNVKSHEQERCSVEKLQDPTPNPGCLYAELHQETKGHSMELASFWNDKVDYTEVQKPFKKDVHISMDKESTTGDSKEVAGLNELTTNNNYITSEQPSVLDNCILYAELKHSGHTKKSLTSAVCREKRKFTMDDKILYSDINHSLTAGNVIRSTSRSSVESARVLDNTPCPMNQQLKPETATITAGIDDVINLDMLLIQLRPQVTSKWHSFGLALGIERETMEKYSSLQDEECLVEILDSWLRNHTGKPSWREIAKALEEVQLHDLAEDVLRSYETGHLPIEVDMEAIPQLD